MIRSHGAELIMLGVTQWDFQNKGTRTSPSRFPFFLKSPHQVTGSCKGPFIKGNRPHKIHTTCYRNRSRDRNSLAVHHSKNVQSIKELKTMTKRFVLTNQQTIDHSRILGIGLELQWATKAVETLLGNDAFRYLSICSISFACSVNSLIPPAPQFNVV